MRGRGAAGVGRAVATMCVGIFCLVVNDSFAKWLTAYYSPLQIVFGRNLLALPIVVALVLWLRGREGLGTRHLMLHAARGVLMVASAYAFFRGIAVLPLAEATSLIFAAPIFITALSVPLLGEKVGWRRWTAVLVGFMGVLIVVRPGAAAFHPASLWVLAAAVQYALLMISARWIGEDEDAWTLMVWVVIFQLLYSGLTAPLVWVPPDPWHLLPVLGMAVFGTLGMTLISQAFRLGAAAVVAPFEYTALIWASLFGWLFWGEVPERWVYLGAAVIVASGIYIVVRETRVRGGG